jgi:hypothetical protein
MTFLQLLPAGLSVVVLAGHFLRGGNAALVVCSLAMLGLLFVRRWWAARIVQVFLVLGSLEWLRALILLVHLRRAFGEPYLRLVAILATVAVVTAASALMFRTARLRGHFGLTAT